MCLEFTSPWRLACSWVWGWVPANHFCSWLRGNTCQFLVVFHVYVAFYVLKLHVMMTAGADGTPSRATGVENHHLLGIVRWINVDIISVLLHGMPVNWHEIYKNNGIILFQLFKKSINIALFLSPLFEKSMSYVLHYFYFRQSTWREEREGNLKRKLKTTMGR
jgi:hypothetical protein